MASTQSYDDVLAARYGRDRSPWRGRILAGLVVAAFGAALVWAAVGLTRPRFEGNIIRWQGRGDAATVVLEVRGSSAGPVHCVLRAQDQSSVDIGYREFRVDRTPSTVSLELPTLFRPATVTVLGCAPADQSLRVPPPDFPPGVAIP